MPSLWLPNAAKLGELSAPFWGYARGQRSFLAHSETHGRTKLGSSQTLRITYVCASHVNAALVRLHGNLETRDEFTLVAVLRRTRVKTCSR